MSDASVPEVLKLEAAPPSFVGIWLTSERPITHRCPRGHQWESHPRVISCECNTFTFGDKSYCLRCIGEFLDQNIGAME